MAGFLQIPDSDRYWLRNARVPLSLLSAQMRDVLTTERSPNYDPLIAIDIEICGSKVRTLSPSGRRQLADIPEIDVHAGMVWPCFVDMHTHLDKGHIWPRSPNPNGTFDGALSAVEKDSQHRWEAEDVYQRAEFGLKCSYAHGTQAIRTHLDAFDQQGEISFGVFDELRKRWAGKLSLQAVCLVTLDYLMGAKGEQLADLVATSGGILGGVTFMNGGANTEIVQQIDRAFELAKERGLDLDFHTDESLNRGDRALRLVAEAALRHNFLGKITCGHCCSLSVQPQEEIERTIALVKEANISIVSLPMCNLYLQHRRPGKTPTHRGVTLLQELKAAGVKCAIASDNCRDPFFAYGDHDALEVFVQSVRIGHLDHPIDRWPQAITRTPAEMMGLETKAGIIDTDSKADLVLFKARNFNELLARSQHDRVVIRSGKQIDMRLPDYAELDALMC